MHIHNTLQSKHSVLADAAATMLQRPIFWQRDRAFITSLCYAKIAPALLRHRDFGACHREPAEPLGRIRKSG
jgi:hypothetical protein